MSSPDLELMLEEIGKQRARAQSSRRQKKTEKERILDFYVKSLPPFLELTKEEKEFYSGNFKNVRKKFDTIDQEGRDNNKDYILDQGQTGTCWLVSNCLALSMFPIGAGGKIDSNHSEQAAKNREVIKSLLYFYLGSTDLCPEFPTELNDLKLSINHNSDIRVHPLSSKDKGSVEPMDVLPRYLEPLKTHLLKKKKRVIFMARPF